MQREELEHRARARLARADYQRLRQSAGLVVVVAGVGELAMSAAAAWPVVVL